MYHSKHLSLPVVFRLTMLAIMVATLAISPPRPVAAQFTLFDLGTLPSGGFSSAHGINDSGAVVGESVSGERSHPVLWQSNTITDLGTFDRQLGSAHGINTSGQIVGQSETGWGEAHAVLWQNDTLTGLGTLGGGSSSAHGINNTGAIVGESQTGSGETHAVLWQNDTLTDLGTLGGGSSSAHGINTSGQIVGQSQTTSGATHAFLWQNDTMIDLGTLGGSVSSASGINTSGQIVGESETGSGETHAFLWQNDTMTDLGTLGGSSSSAHGINTSGQIVGESETGSGETHAFLWQNDTMTDVGTLGGSFSSADGINDSGAAVGESTTVVGEHHAFLVETRRSDGGSIAGRVTDSRGSPVAGAFVQVCLNAGHPCAVTTADTLGQYIVTGLVDGDYSVTAFPPLSSVFRLPGRIGPLTILNGASLARRDIQLETGSGSITGRVISFNGSPVAGAFVQACLNASQSCALTTTNALGQYIVTGLVDGNYSVRAFPPEGADLVPGAIGPLTITNGAALTGQDIQLAHVPEEPVIIMPIRATARSDIPIVYWGDALQLVARGCAGGSASYRVSGSDFVRSGSMTQESDGGYLGLILPFHPDHGYAAVSITIHCPEGYDQATDFVIYIDPSGTVRAVDGTPIAGATVTLFRADSPAGPFEAVPDGSAMMSPANRANPDTTDAAGHFGWDVIVGFYKVRAEKAGCVSPTDPTQSFVESDVLAIPPPVTDLELRLNCDTTPPAIRISRPDDGAHYTLHQSVAARYRCTDAGSGVASCIGTVANGTKIDTASVGAHTFSVNALDNSGNASSASATYNVEYDFSGFLGSIRELPKLNRVRAGSTIVVKFSLHGEQGLDIFAAGYPKSQPIACDSTRRVNGTDPTVTPRDRGLTYKAHTDQYRYPWRTDKAWAGTCRQLVVRLNDGSYQRANFKFLGNEDSDHE